MSAEPPAWLHAIPITRTHLTWRAPDGWRAPPDPGVGVRGALGAAFTDVACLRPPRACAGCELTAMCLVPTWFEPNLFGGGAARPYALRCWGGGGLMRATLTWVGAVASPEAVVAALRGLTPWEGVTLASAVAEGDRRADLLAGEAWPAASTLGALVRWPAGGDVAVVRLRSRLATGSATPPSVDAVLTAMRNRARDVARAAGVATPRWPEVAGAWTELRPQRGGRYSQRQGQPLDLSGWRGELRLEGAAGVADLLAAAEVLQVGRHTTCGLGVVEVAWS